MWGSKKKNEIKDQPEFKLYETLREEYIKMAIELASTDLVASKAYLNAAKEAQRALVDYGEHAIAFQANVARFDIE